MRVSIVRQVAQRFAMLALFLGAASGSGAAAAQTAAPSAGPTPEKRLATEVMRSAMTTAALTPLTSEALDISCILAREAVALDPDNLGLWRLALNIATLAERDDFRADAIDAISRLDPANDNIRLQRINLALDRYPTVEGRAAAYETLLDAANIDRLGPAAASRLALDYALLKQRLGDVDGFTRWLTKAVELDRSNRSAAALAAGFFQANVADPVGRAELLVNLVLADPTNIQTQVTLAQLLLDNGAYTSAVRIYNLIQDGMASALMASSSELMADIAIAQWAAGDIEGALQTIDRRQAEIDEDYRAQRARENTTLTMVEIGALKGPIDPTLATVVAVIHADRHDDQAAQAIATAIAAGEADIQTASKATPPPAAADLAMRHLHLAWMELWLGDDPAKAADHIAAADALQPLNESTRQRFDGWQALKNGQPEKAIETLTPLAEKDSSARVGLALALIAAGREKDAARDLLALNTAQPGSMIGIWAAGELARILGQRVPLSKTAVALDRLISSLPQAFDRYARDATMALSLRATLADANPSPFDPILITVELTNLTNLPLALDRDGPLRTNVLVEPKISSSIPMTGAPKAFIIDIDSRLRLMPRESVKCTFDMRWFEVGDLMNIIATAGGIIRLRFDSNVMATPDGQVIAGLYGVESDAPILRQDGAGPGIDWIAEAVKTIQDPAADPEAMMIRMALLANEITLAESNPTLEPARRDAIEQAKAALPEAFGRMEPTRQAWVLAVTNRAFPVEALLDIARKSDSRLVRLAYLISHLQGIEDPMLDALRRGEDVPLRNAAECFVSQAENAKNRKKAGSTTSQP